ncbi:MAG: hypothetical protein EOP49_10480 [Sphingobacteriales bacterium]|nr:MAG: hypothetical protein EOP49_10480 [Sphingobacteriales bacterium]
MKTVKTILAGLLVGTAVFTSCSKDDFGANPAGTSNGAAAMSKASQETGTATLNSAVVMAGNFRVNDQNGIVYENSRHVPVNMNSMIGELGTPRLMGTHKTLETVIMAVPTDTHPALILSGKYNRADGKTVPVVVNVTRRLTMHRSAPDVTVRGTDPLLTLIGMDMSGLTTEMDSRLWENAQLTNGSIVISENSNLVLYDQIMQRMSQRVNMSWEK